MICTYYWTRKNLRNHRHTLFLSVIKNIMTQNQRGLRSFQACVLRLLHFKNQSYTSKPEGLPFISNMCIASITLPKTRVTLQNQRGFCSFQTCALLLLHFQKPELHFKTSRGASVHFKHVHCVYYTSKTRVTLQKQRSFRSFQTCVLTRKCWKTVSMYSMSGAVSSLSWSIFVSSSLVK